MASHLGLRSLAMSHLWDARLKWVKLPVIYYCPFQDGISIVVPQRNMLLCLCVYGLKQYGHLNNSCPFYFVVYYNLKQKLYIIDAAAVFS